MTPELRELRLGKLCASEAAVICGGDNTDGLKKLVRVKAGERLHGDLEEQGFQSRKMRDGQECEPEALDWADFHFDQALIRGENVSHPLLEWVAATPDGILVVDGFRIPVEVKSPLWHVWSETKERQVIPSQYRWQCRWQAWCLGVRRGWFVSYHRKAGGVVLPFAIDDEDIAYMAKRAAYVEERIQATLVLLRGEG